MNLAFAPQAWEDYLHWRQSGPHIVARTRVLIKNIMRSAHSGIGKTAPLKHALKGYWSRLVYRKSGDQILIAQLRYHY